MEFTTQCAATRPTIPGAVIFQRTSSPRYAVHERPAATSDYYYLDLKYFLPAYFSELHIFTELDPYGYADVCEDTTQGIVVILPVSLRV